MISNLTELLSDGLFEPLISMNTTPSNNPSVGHIYYDTTKKRNYYFDGTNWKELVISSKDGELNKKRMRKINNIFNL